MDMTGTHTIPAPRDAVWAALNDPEVLRACITGCESLEQKSDTQFTAIVLAKIGPVKARFNGTVNLTDLDPPNGYRISGEGSGGVAGFAKGGADVRLTEDGPNTILTYQARAQIGGKLAQLGSRLVDGVAKKMADEFFAAFTARLSPGVQAGAVQAVEASDAPEGGPAPTLGSRVKGWFGRETVPTE